MTADPLRIFCPNCGGQSSKYCGVCGGAGYLERTDTGLIDSNTDPIFVGDVVRCDIDDADNPHGCWSDHVVVCRGQTPCLMYLRSANGQLVPPGYIASILAEYYDRKLFLFSPELHLLRPFTTMRIVKPESDD
jgi:hypothetical protein